MEQCCKSLIISCYESFVKSHVFVTLSLTVPSIISCCPGSSRARFSGGPAAECGDFWGICESSQDGHRSGGIHRTLCQLSATRKQGTRTQTCNLMFNCSENCHVSVCWSCKTSWRRHFSVVVFFFLRRAFFQHYQTLTLLSRFRSWKSMNDIFGFIIIYF